MKEYACNYKIKQTKKPIHSSKEKKNKKQKTKQKQKTNHKNQKYVSFASTI